MRRNILPIIALTAATLAQPARAEVPRVVADTPVTAALAAEVLGTLGQPEVLVGQGGDLHHYQLRPSQARSLQGADLLVWVGPALTPWLGAAAASLGAGAQSLPLLDLVERRGDASDGDPHAWLDPDNGRIWLAAIAGALAARDPEHGATYAANAERAAAELAALDQELQAELAPLRQRRFVVQHDAYGHFTRHFGLAPAIALSAGDAASPSAARLQAVREQILAEGATCAFGEAMQDSSLLDAATEGLGLRRGADLDPEGSQAAPGPGLYAAVLRDLGKALGDCLNG